MAALFGFGAVPVDVEIRLANEQDRKQVESSKATGVAVDGKEAAAASTAKDKDGKKEFCPVYYDGESVAGQVRKQTCVQRIQLKSSDPFSGRCTIKRRQEAATRWHQA